MMRHRQTSWVGSALLLISAVIWGLAFVAQRAGMDYVGPFTFNGVRFALGALVLLPFLRFGDRLSAMRSYDTTPAQQWGGLALAGVVLFVSANLQQMGLVFTTAGKAGFITGLYVVIVPVLGTFRRQRVSGFIWVGCAVAVLGLYLLSVTGRFALSIGDGLVLCSALGWAVHVHIVGWLAERVAPLRAALVQFAICSLLSLLTAAFTETIELRNLVSAGWMIAYAGVLSVGIAYTLQVIGQRRVDPARAGILLSLEALFAVLGGWILLAERLSTRGMIGCGLMLAGMVLAQRRSKPNP